MSWGMNESSPTRNEGTRQMEVNVGSDLVLTVDVNALPAKALEHVIYIGLRNTLMDAHASVTEKTEPDFAKRQAAKRAMAEKKWAALLSGDIRVSGTRVRTGDPILRRAIKIAMEHVTAAWKKANREADLVAQRAEATAKVKANGAFLVVAESQLKQEAELAALIGEDEPANEADEMDEIDQAA